jgi:hypothetical protein
LRFSVITVFFLDYVLAEDHCQDLLEGIHVEWLRKEMRHASLVAGFTVVFRVVCRQSYDRRLTHCLTCIFGQTHEFFENEEDFPRGSEPIHNRHEHIHKDELIRTAPEFVLNLSNSFLAIEGTIRLQVINKQNILQSVDIELIVISYENRTAATALRLRFLF